MSEKKFTFIELHLDGDTQFGPKAIGEAAPFGATGEEEDVATDDEDGTATEEDGGKGAVIGAIVGLIALVGIALAVKKFRGDDEESELEERDEPDIIVS
ncbi:hypothetical protein ACLI4Y_06380 [Natrialbaceae archaeon A-CW3]